MDVKNIAPDFTLSNLLDSVPYKKMWHQKSTRKKFQYDISRNHKIYRNYWEGKQKSPSPPPKETNGIHNKNNKHIKTNNISENECDRIITNEFNRTCWIKWVGLSKLNILWLICRMGRWSPFLRHAPLSKLIILYLNITTRIWINLSSTYI